MEAYKILFIDDDEFIRKIYFDRLSSAGFKVEMADSLTEAKNKLEGGGFDFIFSDYLMADGSGLDLVRWVRQEKKRDTPIVIFSASGQDAKVIAALKEAGANEYLAKDHALPGELVDTVKMILEKNNPKT